MGCQGGKQGIFGIWHRSQRGTGNQNCEWRYKGMDGGRKGFQGKV